MALPAGAQSSGGRIINADGLEVTGIPSSASKGYQQLTSTGSAATVASLCSGAALPTGATKVLLVPSAAVRIRDDGTNPTAAVGYPIAANAEWLYDGDKLSALKVINAATIDAWFFA